MARAHPNRGKREAERGSAPVGSEQPTAPAASGSVHVPEVALVLLHLFDVVGGRSLIHAALEEEIT